MTALIPKNAISDLEIENCFDVMSELRPHLERNQFLKTIRNMGLQGFHLGYLKEGQNTIAVAGYRFARNLFLGKHLYIDDFVTSQKFRSKGYGNILYRWLRDQAVNNGCNYIHLDSGITREEAHRFYFKQGLTISSFHFREKLDQGGDIIKSIVGT